jgi:hypothetical protein
VGRLQRLGATRSLETAASYEATGDERQGSGGISRQNFDNCVSIQVR